MKARLPRVIRLGQYRLAVRRPETIRWPGQRKTDRQTVQATFSWNRKVIDIRADVERMHSRELLLHEILHAIWEYTAMHTDPKLAPFEERVVSATASALVDVLRDNPALVRYLTEEDR